MRNLIMFAVNALLAALPKDVIQGFILSGIDAIKKKVTETTTTIDDALIFPSCNLVLAALQIPGDEIDVSAELNKLFKALGDLTSVFLDAGLDYVEDYFKQGSTMDEIAEKACALVRSVLNVPDNDEPVQKE